MSECIKLLALGVGSSVNYLVGRGYFTALAWLFALGSFLLSYIRVIRSFYRPSLRGAADVLCGAGHNFDILRPVIIFVVSMSWIITHL